MKEEVVTLNHKNMKTKQLESFNIAALLWNMSRLEQFSAYSSTKLCMNPPICTVIPKKKPMSDQYVSPAAVAVRRVVMRVVMEVVSALDVTIEVDV